MLFREEKTMTRARSQLISLEATPYYHCISRCVRRAFLWGEDSFSGKNHEHRKAWVIARLRELADVFAIDICAVSIRPKTLFSNIIWPFNLITPLFRSDPNAPNFPQAYQIQISTAH
jgi:hypothetical protein